MTYIEWLALSILLMMLELFAPGIYLIWFGISGLIVSSILYYEPITLNTQLLLFSAIAAVMVFIGYYIYKFYMKYDGKTSHPHLNDMSAQFVGKTVKVLYDVKNGKTKVQVADTVWIAETDEPFKAGDNAFVAGVRKGVILVLTKK